MVKISIKVAIKMVFKVQHMDQMQEV